MTKAQKIIVITAGILILIASLFPPYRDCPFNDKGEWIGKCYVKWEFNKDFQDMIRSIKDISFRSSGIEFELMHIEYPLMRQLLFLEIGGVLILAGAALLIVRNAK
jgi:hypothetical protein